MNAHVRISRVQGEYSGNAKRILSRSPALFIDNEWVEPAGIATIPVIDPSHGCEVGRIDHLRGHAPGMRVVRKEIFGPVVVAQRFDDLDEVLKAANDTPFGLGASVWTRDLSTMHRLIAGIRSGTVWGNCHAVMGPALPFGGYKQSAQRPRAEPPTRRGLYRMEDRRGETLNGRVGTAP